MKQFFSGFAAALLLFFCIFFLASRQASKPEEKANVLMLEYDKLPEIQRDKKNRIFLELCAMLPQLPNRKNVNLWLSARGRCT